jgi:hypothetical protein
MSEDKLNKRISRAKRASILMQDELIREAFEALQKSYTEALFTSHAMAAAEREKLYLAYNVVGKVKEHLAAVLADGNLAAKELADLN